MIFSRLSSDEIGSFYRQIAVMLRSGVSLSDAVSALSDERDLPRVRKKAARIKKDLADNISLRDSFAKHPNLFSPALIKILSSDIPSEKAAEVLQKFADTEERTGKVSSKVASILVYPVAVLCIAISITLVLLIFVIPVFQEMFSDMGGKLPPLTQLVVSISEVTKSNLLYIIIFFIIVATSFIISRKLFYFVASKLPIIGASLKKIAISNFAEYFSLMLSVDIPLIEALEIAADSIKNPYYAGIFKEIGAKVSDIRGLKEEMRSSCLFPVVLLKTIEIRETPQALETAMAETANFYEKGMGKYIEKKLVIFEVIMMVFLGITIGGLVIAMYLPIFKMASVL